MIQNEQHGHILNLKEISSLVNRVQQGDKSAEEDLTRELTLGQIIDPIVLKGARDHAEIEDRVQDIYLHLILVLRRRKEPIKDPVAFIKTTALNYLRDGFDRHKARKRGPLRIKSLEGNEERARKEGLPVPPEGEPVLGERPDEPDEIEERHENGGAQRIADLYAKEFAPKFRAGIEKSLDLIADLFELREYLRQDRIQGSHILKAIGALIEARRIVARTLHPAPQDKELMRLYELREFSPRPAFDGTPETTAKVHALLSEERELWNKYGAVYSLFIKQRELESEFYCAPGRNEMIPGPEPWSPYLSAIGRMKLSPGAVIFKVWSRARGFRKGNLLKYRDRKKMGLAIQHHKIASKGTPRESLFSSIPDLREIKDPERALERFRKAGYGQPLQKKYRGIIKLISRLSFGMPASAREEMRIDAYVPGGKND